MLKVNDVRSVKVTVEFHATELNTESIVDTVIYMNQIPSRSNMTRIRAVETRHVEYRPELS